MLDFLQKLNTWLQAKSPYRFGDQVKNSGDVVLWCLQQVKRPICGLYRNKKGEHLVRVVKIDMEQSLKQQQLIVQLDSIQGRTSVVFEQFLLDYQYLYQSQPNELTTADLS